nr:sialate O-acetylesterase [Bifidobacterium hapali]
MMSTNQVATGPAPGANMSGLAGGDSNAAIDKPIGTPELRPAAIFSHDMVLQRHQPIPVFGTGTPGRTVIVKLLQNGSTEPLKVITRCDETQLDAHAQLNTSAQMTQHNSESFDHIQSNTSPSVRSIHSTDITSTIGSKLGHRNGAEPVHFAASDSVSAFTTIDASGHWLVTLPALEAGGPYELSISDHSGVTLRYLRVYVGEVWLAGGQSNMELELRNSEHADAAVAASADPLLCFYNTPKTGVIDTEAEDHAIWQVSGPDTSGTMSAVAYYFARRLRAELGADVPVGIIDCYIGGTSITSWMSRATLESCEAGQAYLNRFSNAIAGKTDEQFEAETTAWKTKFDAWNEAIGKARAAEPDITWDTLNEQYGACPWPPPVTPTSQYRPTGPFGTMIERVAPYGIAGFLWYQGEEDESYCESYGELLPRLIAEWRGLWANYTDTSPCAAHHTMSSTTSPQPVHEVSCVQHNTDHDNTDHAAACEIRPLPFLIVQLPQWIDKTVADADPMHWPVIREAQWAAAREIPRTYTITTIDCGEFDNIHPTDKRTPGERLANCALHYVYDRGDIPVDGPQCVTAQAEPVAFKAGSRETQDGATAECTVIVQFDHAGGLQFDGTVPGTYRRPAMATRDDDIDQQAISSGDKQDVTPSDMPLSEEALVNGSESCDDRYYRAACDSGFEVAGADGIFRPAAATIEVHTDDVSAGTGDTTTAADHATVLLSAPDIGGKPKAVRYAWRSWGPAPLFNGDGLPAPPFWTKVQ